MSVKVTLDTQLGPIGKLLLDKVLRKSGLKPKRVAAKVYTAFPVAFGQMELGPKRAQRVEPVLLSGIAEGVLKRGHSV